MITVNGKLTGYREGQSLISFLEDKNLELKKIVVEYNKEILSRENWEETVLKDNDSLEIISFVGGG